MLEPKIRKFHFYTTRKADKIVVATSVGAVMRYRQGFSWTRKGKKGLKTKVTLYLSQKNTPGFRRRKIKGGFTCVRLGRDKSLKMAILRAAKAYDCFSDISPSYYELPSRWFAYAVVEKL